MKRIVSCWDINCPFVVNVCVLLVCVLWHVHPFGGLALICSTLVPLSRGWYCISWQEGPKLVPGLIVSCLSGGGGFQLWAQCSPTSLLPKTHCPCKTQYWSTGMSRAGEQPIVEGSGVWMSSNTTTGRELQQYHITSFPKSKLVVEPPSFLWFKNYSSVFRVSQHEVSFLDCDVVFTFISFFFPEHSASPGLRCCSISPRGSQNVLCSQNGLFIQGVYVYTLILKNALWSSLFFCSVTHLLRQKQD